MKKLSIIAPCYNGENYVKRFLDSMLAQTYKFIELILVNDGSTDTTEEILIDYETKFRCAGMEYIHIKQNNQGIGGAINNALKSVTGDYLSWFGTDDYALPTYAEELVGFLENNQEFAVVRNDGFLVDEDDTSIITGRMADHNFDKHNPWLFENAITEKNFHFGYSVLRMDIFDKVNPNREIYPSRQGQNWQLLLPIFYHYKSAFYEKPLYCVIDQKVSVSRLTNQPYEKIKAVEYEYEKILLETLNSMEISDREKYIKIVRVKYIRRRMKIAITLGERADALKEYKLLKKEKAVLLEDRKHYLRARFSLVDKIIRRTRKK